MHLIPKLFRLFICVLAVCFFGLCAATATAQNGAPRRPGAAAAPVAAPPAAPALNLQLAPELLTTDTVRDAQRVCAKLTLADQNTFKCNTWKATSPLRAVPDFGGSLCATISKLPTFQVPIELKNEELSLLLSCSKQQDPRLRAIVQDSCATAVQTAHQNTVSTAAKAASAKEAQEQAKKAKKDAQGIKAANEAADTTTAAAVAAAQLEPLIVADCQAAAIQSLTCASSADVRKHLRTLGDADTAAQVDTLCGGLSAGGLDIASIGTVALQGLGDYLKETAKQELVDYALDHLGRDFCKNGSPLRGDKLFPITCTAHFPKGTDGDADTSVILGGKLPGLIKQDVNSLPAEAVLALLSSDASPGLRTLLDKVLRDLIPQLAQKPDVLTLLANLRADGRTALMDPTAPMSKTCDFRNAHQPTECVLALFLEIAGQAKESFAADGTVTPTSLQGWLESASKNFCTNYGTSADGACVFGASTAFWQHVTDWSQSILALYKQLAGTQREVRSALSAGRFSVETQPLVNTETSQGFLDFFDQCLDTFETLYSADTTWGKGGNKDKLARVSADLVAAAIGKNSDQVLSDIQELATNPIVSANVDANVLKSITFVAAIGQAKTRDDARQVIENVAAPLGTWKAKFSADTVMINGYVGVFGAARTPLSKHGGDPAYVAMDHSVLRPLSAPIGFEFSYRLDPHWHAGFALVLIDPLALRVDQQSGVYHTNFDDVLTPGVLGHVSIYSLPLDLVIGGQIQPFSRSAETCANDHACWRGAASLMVGLVVDAPLLQLK
jgi:hypothetical protein